MMMLALLTSLSIDEWDISMWTRKMSPALLYCPDQPQVITSVAMTQLVASLIPATMKTITRILKIHPQLSYIYIFNFCLLPKSIDVHFLCITCWHSMHCNVFMVCGAMNMINPCHVVSLWSNKLVKINKFNDYHVRQASLASTVKLLSISPSWFEIVATITIELVCLMRAA